MIFFHRVWRTKDETHSTNEQWWHFNYHLPNPFPQQFQKHYIYPKLNASESGNITCIKHIKHRLILPQWLPIEMVWWEKLPSIFNNKISSRKKHYSKFTRWILHTKLVVGRSGWFPTSDFTKSFKWSLRVERHEWNAARIGGINIDKAESTLLKYFMSDNSCCAPRSIMYWILHNCSM